MTRELKYSLALLFSSACACYSCKCGNSLLTALVCTLVGKVECESTSLFIVRCMCACIGACTTKPLRSHIPRVDL